jgi:hypothetical protein
VSIIHQDTATPQQSVAPLVTSHQASSTFDPHPGFDTGQSEPILGWCDGCQSPYNTAFYSQDPDDISEPPAVCPLCQSPGLFVWRSPCCQWWAECFDCGWEGNAPEETPW